MKLVDLEPLFITYRVLPCADANCVIVTPHTEHEQHGGVDTIGEADGVRFLCPKCLADKGNRRGVHYVICWRPRVPPHVTPNPGRWELVGTGYDDLSLVAGSSSVLIRGGCNAHFFIERGAVRMT